MMSNDCIPLLNAQKYTDYRTCALNTLDKASKLVEAKDAWCNDSDGGVDFLKKGVVKTDLKPNGIEDYVYTFGGGGGTYLMEGACSSSNQYMYYQKNCSELGAKYVADVGAGACVLKNGAPVIEAIGDKTVKEGELLMFVVKASDADGDKLIYSADGLPSGAKFEGGVFSWVPYFDQSGTYKVTFKVSDDTVTTAQIVTINVIDFHGWLPMSTVGAPPGTYWGSSVWTGEEMFVFGGNHVDVTAKPVNSGGLYNPKTNTWKTISKVGAPSARQFGWTPLIWTGKEVIVWGGNNSGDIFGDGAKYNPKTDTWTPISMINAPQARTGHTAIWTGSEMIVWGGVGGPNGSVSLNDGGRYNPGTDSWSSIAMKDAPLKNGDYRAVWTGNKMIVWGGIYSYFESKPNVQLGYGGMYDPNTDSWTQITSEGAPAGRGNFTAIWNGNDMIIFGGYTYEVNKDGENNDHALNDGWNFNPSSMKWTKISDLNAPASRYRNTAVWTGAKMIIFGGYNNKPDNQPNEPKWYNDGYSYNSTNDSWEKLLSINSPVERSDHQSVWTGDMMLIWAGQNDGKSIDGGARYIP